MQIATVVAVGGHNKRQPKNKYAHERREARRLWTSSHERCHRRGRAFVNIRRPDVKRRGGNLETKTDKHHCHAGKEQGGILSVVNTTGEFRDIGCPGNDATERSTWSRLANRCRSINKCDTVKQECRRERTENEVFQRRLV